MLFPMKRKAGVELTRILPGEDAFWSLTDEEIIRYAKQRRFSKHFCVYTLQAVLAAMHCPENELKHAAIGREVLDKLLEENAIAKIREILREPLIAFLMRKHKWVSAHAVASAEEFFLSAYPTLINHVGTDPCCHEISSKPLKSWTKLRAFFDITDQFLDSMGDLRSSDVIAGTAGHIHVEVKHLGEAMIVRQHFLNNPWVMMAFTDPRDDQPFLENESRKHFKSRTNIPVLQLPQWFYEENIEYFKTPEYLNYRWGPAPFRQKYSTVEFRCFDIAQTWEMQEEHMAFAQAFTEYAIKQGRPTSFLSREDVLTLSVNDCKKGFEKLIVTLGLPWHRYAAYARENIETRFELGTMSVVPTEFELGTMSVVPTEEEASSIDGSLVLATLIEEFSNGRRIRITGERQRRREAKRKAKQQPKMAPSGPQFFDCYGNLLRNTRDSVDVIVPVVTTSTFNAIVFPPLIST
jgi:hypothetical protein